MSADTLFSAIKRLVDAVGSLLENGRGTEQGIELNHAYSQACAALELPAALVEQEVRRERFACQEIALRYGGDDAEEIAEMIGARNFRD